MVKRLAPSVKVGGYKIRPPKGYQARSQAGPGGSVAYAWTGAPRPDGTSPMLMLAIAPIPSGTTSTVQQVAEQFIGAVQRRRTNFHQGRPQTGTIGGLKFVRIAWTGTASEISRKMEGIQYVAIDNGHVVEIWSQDVLPASRQALKLSEAAILSFRK